MFPDEGVTGTSRISLGQVEPESSGKQGGCLPPAPFRLHPGRCAIAGVNAGKPASPFENRRGGFEKDKTQMADSSSMFNQCGVRGAPRSKWTGHLELGVEAYCASLSVLSARGPKDGGCGSPQSDNYPDNGSEGAFGRSWPACSRTAMEPARPALRS